MSCDQQQYLRALSVFIQALPCSDKDVRVMVDVAADHPVNSARLRGLQTLTEQLRGVLNSRVVIEQAEGFVSNDCRIGVDDAFQPIRRYARNHDANNHNVAEAIVSVGPRPP